MEHLQNFIGDCDKRTEIAKRKLKETQEELSEEATAKVWTSADFYSVECCYNTVNFLTNIHKRHPIACSLGLLSFVDPLSDWYSASVPVIIYVTSYNIRLCYNYTRL